MNLFSKEISQNRYSFLKFLDSKPNIRVIDDLPRHINKTLQKQTEQGFSVDIIIYYALSSNIKWRDIKTINFDAPSPSIVEHIEIACPGYELTSDGPVYKQEKKDSDEK